MIHDEDDTFLKIIYFSISCSLVQDYSLVCQRHPSAPEINRKDLWEKIQRERRNKYIHSLIFRVIFQDNSLENYAFSEDRLTFFTFH